MIDDPSKSLLQVEQEIISIMMRYPNHSMSIVIQDDTTGERMFAGNMCPVCTFEYLAQAILDNGLKHQGEEGSVH